MVYVVIPVFNRLATTLDCIEKLKRQTFRDLKIIVADGGSTDGSPEVIRKTHPEVLVLQSSETLWWAGSMGLGIDWALKNSLTESDFVLMMNNDTDFPENYVEILVQESGNSGAAVGALTVDSKDHSKILDAGEYVDWKIYQFPVKTKIQENEVECTDVDFLPGRGSLVPVAAIRRSGNINYQTLPHYISDYEFFYRLKMNGTPLKVTYKTWVGAYTEMTGLFDEGRTTLSFGKIKDLYFSRRSMSNFYDHWNFIKLCAPQARRRRLQIQLVKSYIQTALDRHPIVGPGYRLVRSVYRAFKHLGFYFHRAFVAVLDVLGLTNALRQGIDGLLKNPRFSESVLKAHGFEASELLKSKIVYQDNSDLTFSRKFLIRSRLLGFKDLELETLYTKLNGVQS